MLLMVCLLFVCSCKKSPDENSADNPDEQADSKTTNVAKQIPGIKAPGTVLVPIDIKLPQAVFKGTPGNIRGITNVEKPLGHARLPFYAPAGTKNVAFEKPVTTAEEPIIGEVKMITDGDKEATDNSFVELGPFLQSVTIDLGAQHDIYAILLWHYHSQARVYLDVIVQVANDPDFKTNVTTIFNNDDDNSANLGAGNDKNYVETAEGKLIDAKGVQGRYLRLYSNGNNDNDLNNYTEVEVFGKPTK